MLIVAGDNADRVRSEPAWARLLGVAPVPASSGMTTRHRLNRGGHRQANAALYRSVIVRMQYPRTDQGLRRPPHRRRQDQTRDHPLPQTTPRPRDLDPHAPIPGSVSRPPEPQLDSYRSINALAETIIGFYKTELFKPEGPWRTADHVELATLEWVDWFNHRRLYEHCGDIPPAELEAAYYRQHRARQTAEFSNK